MKIAHIYKKSGDNYIFMVNSNGEYPWGTAISRSRFEDDAFTLGDNLKQGVKTKKYGIIKIEKHTELKLFLMILQLEIYTLELEILYKMVKIWIAITRI